MEPGHLRVDASRLRATADIWYERSTDLLGTPATLTRGQPFQPATAAVVSAHAAVALTSTTLKTRIRATISAVEASAADYLNNEAIAAAEMAAVPDVYVV